MDVEALREAARSGKLAHDPEVIKPRPPPGAALKKALEDMGVAFAKTVDAVKGALDEAWFKISGEEGPPGYGADQLLIAIAAHLTKEQTVPTGVGPVEVRIPVPTMDAADKAMKKLADDIEVIARTTGSPVADVEAAVRKLESMAPALHEATGGTAGPASPVEVIRGKLDAMEMFGEGALYANDVRVGPIIAARSTRSMSGPDETRFTVGLADRGPKEVTALLEARLGEGRLEFRLAARGALASAFPRRIPLDKSWVDSVLGAMKDDRDWEHTVVLADEA